MVVRDRQQDPSLDRAASPEHPKTARRYDDWSDRDDDWDDDGANEEQAVDPLSRAEAVTLLGERALRPSRMTPARVVMA